MRYVLVLLLIVLVGGCASTDAVPLSSENSRALTPGEKGSIGTAVSSKLKDPASAAFRWMPVSLVQRNDGSGITDYCGLVNAKTSYGGYAGFSMFYVQMRKNNQGQFSDIDLRLLMNHADAVSVRATEGACRQFGYVDFSQALP
jgi:hypothetical protein